MSRLQGRAIILGAVLAAAGCEYMGYDLTGGGYVVTFRQGALEWQALPPFLERDLEDSKTYCSELELLGSGWRIPTPEELYGLYLARKDFPSVPGLEDGEYWSASGATGTKIDFEDGEVFEWSYIFSSTYRVRCVRAAPVDEGGGAGGGTFSQPSTGLVWQRVSPGEMTWYDANAYCAGLSLPGQGWRLPTLEELQYLWMDRASFSGVPGLDDGWYWSSWSDGSSGRKIAFTNGATGYDSVDTTLLVRCVRSPSVEGGSDTFLQSSAGLEWQRAVPGQESFYGAAAYCNDLSLAGGGWRLPTSGELLGLWDERGVYSGVPGLEEGYWYWSSTVEGPFPCAVSGGQSGCANADETLWVRCVR